MKLLEQRILLGHMPGLAFMGANGQLISASSMVGFGGIPGLPGTGLAGSAPVPATANYPPSILPSPSGGLYACTHFRGNK